MKANETNNNLGKADLNHRIALFLDSKIFGPTDTSMGHPRPGSGGHSPPNFNMAKLMNAFTS